MEWKRGCQLLWMWQGWRQTLLALLAGMCVHMQYILNINRERRYLSMYSSTGRSLRQFRIVRSAVEK